MSNEFRKKENETKFREGDGEIKFRKDGREKKFSPIPRQALGYAEWVRGEEIHPRTLAVNTAFILQ